MDIGLVGLGKMGGNMRERLRNAGHTVVGYDRNPDVSDVGSLAELVEQLPSPKVVWVMVPAGDPTRETDQGARRPARRGRPGRRRRQLHAGPTTRSNAELLAEKGVGFVDCGVSGGVWGLENGYALMCGGSADDVAKVQPAFDALKPEGEFGFVHAGKVGAGHFAKMVHNGIEYAIMQAYAEGWELLEKVDLVDNVTEVFRSWREGTVIRSWLLDLLVAALDEDARLDKIARLRRGLRRGPLDRRGRHRQRRRRCPAITAALFARFVSRQDDCPAMKAVAAMRNQFGGHAVHGTEARPPGGDARRPAGEPGESDPVYVAHLTLHDFRSYADLDVALEPGATAFIGRNGQGKTNLVEAIDYLVPARLAPGRRDAPLVRAGADQAVVRAAVVRDGRTRGARGRAQPRARPTGPGSTGRRLPRARELRRPGAHGGLLPRGPGPGQGRPVRPARVPRRPAGAAHAAAGRRPRRLRPGAQAAQLPAQDRRRRAARLVAQEARAVDARRSGTTTSPGTGAELLGRAAAAGRRAAALRRQGLRDRGPRGRARRRRDRLPALASSWPTVGRPRDRATLDRAAARASWSAAARTSSTAASRWSARTATSCCSPSATPQPRLPVKGYASHGESWSFALALRLASYDLLRADGDDPILILDDVFAELDAERRAQLADLVAGAEQVLVTAAVAADVPAALAGHPLPGRRRGGDP